MRSDFELDGTTINLTRVNLTRLSLLSLRCRAEA